MRRSTFRMLVLCGALFLNAATSRAQGVITTVAGSTWVFRGEGRPGTAAPLGQIRGVAVDSAGNVYASDVGDNGVVKISTDGIVTLFAGNGFYDYAGDGGPARGASLYNPQGLAVDTGGNLFLADRDNQVVRKISPGGTITTVAGNGSFGSSGDGGPATAARLASPVAVALDGAGNLYIAELDGHRIRKVSLNGTITTVAGSGPIGDGQGGFTGDNGPATSARLNSPSGVAVDTAGNIYIADSANHRIRKVSTAGTITTAAGGGSSSLGDNGPATSASLSFPRDVAVNTAGNLFIVDNYNQRIRKVTPGGTITTVAGSGATGFGAGSFSGDGGPATSARLNSPTGIAVDSAGNLYIADNDNYRVRKVTAAGTMSTLAGNGLFKFAGDGGPATSASLYGPSSAVVDPSGNLYITDTNNNRIRKVDASGILNTIAGNGIPGFSGDGGPATGASLNAPRGLALDSGGNLYVPDNLRIRRVTRAGVIDTVAGNGSYGSAGDGGPATGASFSDPRGLVVDSAGNVYVGDAGANRVRKFAPGGTITAIAGSGAPGFSGDGGPAASAQLNAPQGLALDAAGNLLIADTANHRIRKITPGGTINTVAGNGGAASTGDGGPAVNASLYGPFAVAVGSAGNLYIAEYDGSRVRKVNTAGTIATIAGTGAIFLGERELYLATGVAVDGSGAVYFADQGFDRIRKIVPSTILVSFSILPASLSFAAGASSAPPPPADIALVSAVPNLPWQATVRTQSGGNWLAVSDTSGQMPATLYVSADPTNLTPSTYQGSVVISVPGTTVPAQTIPVTFVVSQARPPQLSARPTEMDFRMLSGGAAPPAQLLHIENAGTGTLNWTAQASAVGGAWLVVSATAGRSSPTAPAGVQVSVNPASLGAGSYSGSITVRSADTNQSITIPVTLLLRTPAGVLALSQSSMLFRAVEGGGTEPAQTFGVLNVGSGSLDWTAQANAPWLRVSPESGRSDAGGEHTPGHGVG